MNELLELDRKLFLAVNGLSCPELNGLLGWPTYVGTTFILVSLVFLCMLIFDRRELFRKYALILAVLLISDASVTGMKMFFGRPRPFTYFRDITPVSVLFNEPASYSFPSGHASLVFCTAVLINCLYGHRLKYLYALALLVAVSRIYVGVHYPSDVLAGALYGSLFAWLSSRLILQNFPLLFVKKA